MIRRVIQDSSFYIIATFLSRGINILLLPLYTKILVPKDYGDIDMLYTFAAIINLVLALEVSQALGRFLPDNPEPENRVRYISAGYWFTVIVFIVFGVSMVASAPYTSHMILSDDVSEYAFIVGILSITFQGPYLYLVNVLKWTLQAKANAIISVVTSLITVLVTVFTLVYLDMGITGVFVANLTGTLTGGVIAFILLRKNIAFILSMSHLKEMLHFSGPLVFSSAAVFISLYTDRIFLKYFHGADAVGLYGVAFRFASVVHLVLYGIQTAVTPLIINHYIEPSTPGKIEQMFRYFLVLISVPILGYTLFCKDVLVIFTSPQYYAAWFAIPLITLSIIFSGMYVFMPGLTIAKRSSKIAMISIVSAVMNIIMAWVLIPRYDITGAAIATLLSAVLMFALYFYQNQKYYPLTMDVTRYLLFISALILFTFVAAEFVSRTAFTVTTTLMMLKILFLITGMLFVTAILIRKDELTTLSAIVKEKVRPGKN
jgi:O-antigen/teichoic acid export membrane protein